MFVVLIVGLLGALIIPVYKNALKQAQRRALFADCHEFYDSFMRYHFDAGKFPAEGAGGFNKITLEPLSTEGYFSHVTSFNTKLLNRKILVYIAPDVGGKDSQFFAVMRQATDPTTIVYVGYTNVIHPASGGWLDGVYTLYAGKIVPVADSD